MLSARFAMRRSTLSAPSWKRACDAYVARKALHMAARPFAPRTAKRSFCSSAPLGSGNSLLVVAKRYPFATQATVATLKTGAADILVQMQVEGRSWEEVDLRRSSLFFLFGFAYLGVAQWGIYVVGFQRVLRR